MFTWEHQYANYLNSLYDELMEYGEVTKLGGIQLKDLLNCIPNHKIEQEYEGKQLWTVWIR